MLNSVVIARINPPERQTAVMKLTFKSQLDRQNVAENARKLKNNEQLKQVFIKADRTPLANKEDYRLRQKKRQILMDNPGARITLYKGVLSNDGIKIDEHNIKNQLFRPNST